MGNKNLTSPSGIQWNLAASHLLSCSAASRAIQILNIVANWSLQSTHSAAWTSRQHSWMHVRGSLWKVNATWRVKWGLQAHCSSFHRTRSLLSLPLLSHSYGFSGLCFRLLWVAQHCHTSFGVIYSWTSGICYSRKMAWLAWVTFLVYSH